MDIIFPYTRKRREFGKPCAFTITPPEILYEFKSNLAKQKKFLVAEKVSVSAQSAPDFSQHEVNTEVLHPVQRGMMHLEGGWPKDIDPNEPDHLNMFRKKVERDENFIHQLDNMTANATAIMNQNLSLDIYQEYFSDYTGDVSVEPPKAQIVSVLRDPFATYKRWANCVSWQPDDKSKIAIAYSILRFQGTLPDMPVSSHIWDLHNPNVPLSDLIPSSPLCSVEYNLKDFNVLVGGCYNGLVSFWDLRKGVLPFDSSPIEKCHRDPVYKVQWLQSKTGAECASISSDGFVYWWDMRKLTDPIESLEMINKTDNSKLSGTSMDYDPQLGPSKFVVGTEQGAILSCNRKAKTNLEKVSTPFVGHIGPVYSVQRNWAHSRFFLSVGDWSARIWIDDFRMPVMCTPFESTYMAAAAWSPTRPSVYYTAKSDGSLDAWDLLSQQRVLNVQVTESRNVGLASLTVHSSGKTLAAGATDGTVYINDVSESLYVLGTNDKTDLLVVLEREAKREKNVDARMKELRLKERKEGGGAPGAASGSAAGAAKPTTPGTPEGPSGSAGSAARSPIRSSSSGVLQPMQVNADEDYDISEGDLGAIEKEFFEKVSQEEI